MGSGYEPTKEEDLREGAAGEFGKPAPWEVIHQALNISVPTR